MVEFTRYNKIMTLIAGARTWCGVCIATDTRVTCRPPAASAYPMDDCQKIDMIRGGLSIAVAGDGRVSALLYEHLTNNHIKMYQEFLARRQGGDTTDYDPNTVLKAVVEESLREVANLSEVYQRPADETRICGMVGFVDSIPLCLNSLECQSLLDIVAKLPDGLRANWILGKYAKAFSECARGVVSEVSLSEFRQNSLFTYESVLGSVKTKAVLKVEPVPFGCIAAAGSGVSKDHNEQQLTTLSYMLIATPPNNIQDIAFHLTRTHGWSDIVVAEDTRYGFKTFGGATLATFLVEDTKNPGHVELALLKGDFGRKSDGKIVSTVFENKEGKLCVSNQDGVDYVLVPFHHYGHPGTSNYSF